MTEQRIVKTVEGDTCRIDGADGNTLMTLSPKAWDSSFFERRIALLQIESGAPLTDDRLTKALDAALAFADERGVDLIELAQNVGAWTALAVFEDRGFRLVDSKVTFITRLERRDLRPPQWDGGAIDFATIDDLGDILRLTKAGFVDNPAFNSRFKNRRYFTPEQSERYFNAWIENHIEDKDTLFAVLRAEGRVDGYYFYKRSGDHKGEALYKGMLAVVDPRHRGKRLHLELQAFLYGHFKGDAFYVDNTTQVTNLPTLRNHVTSQKKLERIELVFFRADPNKPSSSDPKKHA